MKHVLLALYFVGAGVIVAACGGTSESVFSSQEGEHGSDDPNAGKSFGDIDVGGTTSACVTEVASATLAPTNLVFVYDKSGSMGDTLTGFDPQRKWLPVGEGVKQFFGDPYSKTVRASLQFFPLSDTSIASACAHPYSAPTVPLAPASDAAFVRALDDAKPSGGTPTLPALQGGVQYARSVAATRPGDKTAVVLVTDGEPGFWDPAANAFVPGCANNDVAHVAETAASSFAGTPRVPVYVIGVGPQLASLNRVAAAGGTGAAIMVNVSDPGSTKAAIVAALDGIRRREVACDFSIPPPPRGEELDPNAVNVVHKRANGTEVVLAHDPDCATPEGWRYDDRTKPTRILLCAASCDAVKRSADGQVAIAYGCKTKVALR
jgi:hypothetical protein